MKMSKSMLEYPLPQIAAISPHMNKKFLKSEIFDFSEQTLLSIDGFDKRPLDLLIKISQFLISFSKNFDVKVDSIEELAVLIKDPDYNNIKIAKIHHNLLKHLEKEVENIKAKQGTWIKLLINNIFPSVEGKESFVPKKVMESSVEIWKQPLKVFIHNLAGALDCPNLNNLISFAKRGAVNIRLELLSFLIDLVSNMDFFREIIGAIGEEYKNMKMSCENLFTMKRKVQGNIIYPLAPSKQVENFNTKDIKFQHLENNMQLTHEQIKNNEQIAQTVSEIVVETDDLLQKMVLSPLKICLGRTNNSHFFLLKDEVFMKDFASGKYYILDNKTLTKLRNTMNVRLKSQKCFDQNIYDVMVYFEKIKW